MKLITLLIVTLAWVSPARADRTGLADAFTKLSTSAANLGKTAKSSDDRGARKRFAPAAIELGDDLAALARRLAKDVPMKAIAADAIEADRAAAKLVELADEVEDKEDRKSLRAQASLIEQGIAGLRKQLDAKEDAAPAAASRFTGRLINNSDACSWAENLKFVVSRDGTQVFASQMVFPGKDLPLVLEKGRYLVQFLDTSGKPLGQAALDASHEGWSFKSGCVNQN